MATGATLLQAMADADDQFDTTAHQAIGLRCLNIAQDMMERQAALRPRVFQTSQDITTTQATETTSRPSGMIRLDKAVMENDSGRGWFEMKACHDFAMTRDMHTGAPPWVLVQGTGQGRPWKYYLDKDNFYWGPYDPDGTHTVRLFGLFAADDITNGGTFAYPDDLIPALAMAALVYFRTGVEDATEVHQAQAMAYLIPVLDSIEKEWQHGQHEPRYTEVHRA